MGIVIDKTYKQENKGIVYIFRAQYKTYLECMKAIVYIGELKVLGNDIKSTYEGFLIKEKHIGLWEKVI